MTKEELIAENAILKQEKQKLKEDEETMKKEFSKILGAGFYVKEQFTYDNKPIVYSWCEIFAETGKLLVKKRDWTVEGELEHLSYEVEKLRELFKKQVDDKINK